MLIRLANSEMLLELRAPNAIRVQVGPDSKALGESGFVLVAASNKRIWHSVEERASEVVVRTAELTVRVNLKSETASFFNAIGKPILSERDRFFEPATVDGERTFHVRQRWNSTPNESLYGLGQHPSGPLDIKGIDLDLWQRNSSVVVPMLSSSKGYGIYWNNDSFSRFGDLRKASSIPPEEQFGTDGKSGGLTGTFYAGTKFDRQVATRSDAKIEYLNPVSGDGLGFTPDELKLRPAQPATGGRGRGNSDLHPKLPGGDVSARWEGYLEPQITGTYLFDAYWSGGLKLYIDGRLLINHWRQSWLPERDVVRMPLVKGVRSHIRIEWVKDQGANTLVFRWKTPNSSDATSLWSEVAKCVDYTFIYGPSLDRVVQGVRNLTGRATMPPKWALGLWQSRQRYETQQQSLEAVDGFRKRGIPFDNIVQDWFYWKADAWGSHEFDPKRFPDPLGWIDQIHKLHANLMISVWGKFYPGTKNFDELRSKGFLYEPNLADHTRDWVNQPFTFFDPFRPESRELFWSQIDRELFKKGVDAWWMDASEPDLMSVPNLEGHRARMNPTGLGSPSKGINLYALATAQAVYEGQRKSAPNQRVFNLTRSGYMGQQRYGAATWSGDITSTWSAMARQIPAGLGFSISGIPYWTMDAGGFSVPTRFASRSPKPEDLAEWRELNTRWFEFATFVPLLRVHGEFPYREMWQFGGEDSPTYKAMLRFDTLRYRLLPYIYSLSGEVTQNGATIMRPLAMDYPGDDRLRGLSDEYLFGHAFLVSPVLHYKQRKRVVQLPRGEWYDFWTGELLPGGGSVESDAPYDAIPLHVRSGSIVPIGPDIQYTSERPADPVTLIVYMGSDGNYSLYEDDGLTNRYEKGDFTRIPITWSESSKTLTIGKRVGEFKGMLGTRTFRIRFASAKRPTPFTTNLPFDREVRYTGQLMRVRS